MRLWTAAFLLSETTGGLHLLQQQQQPALAHFSGCPVAVKRKGETKPRGYGVLCRFAASDDDNVQPAKTPLRKSKPMASTKSSSRSSSSKGDEAAATALSKKTKSKKQKSVKSSEEPTHWICEEDPFDYITAWDSKADFLRFTIRGNPVPLRRHRTSRGFVYNPSAKAQESFRQKVQELLLNNNITTTTTLPGADLSNTTDKSTALPPLFGNDTALAMTIVFYTKRPNIDFIGERPGEGRLRNTLNSPRTQRVAPNRLHPPTRIDVDNLAKFVLDSLNGVLYDDDKQVVSLHVTKLRDDVGKCKGSTDVLVRVIRPDDVDTLLERMVNLF